MTDVLDGQLYEKLRTDRTGTLHTSARHGPSRRRRILVIKHGALGDIVLAFGPFAAIRAHEPGQITAMTTAPYADLLRRSPWFDRVVVDARPAPWDVLGLLRLRRALGGFDFVYDLQTSSRSSRYHRLAGRPAWSGIARGASHAHANFARNAMHTVERQRDQLVTAGIACFPPPEFEWLMGAGPMLPGPYAVLTPGAAPHRPAKRWPAERFGRLAMLLAARGIRPVIVGTDADSDAAAAIIAVCPDAESWVGQTTLFDLAGLAARAVLAIGNDTGPMHLAAAVGTRCIVLFGGASDPSLTAPRGDVTVLRAENLAELSVDRVAAALP